MSILHVWRRPYTRLAKRTFDIASASFGLLLERTALAGDRPPRPNEPRARDLPPDAGRRRREALHHAEVPHDAGRRRVRLRRLHRDRRRARHARRPCSPDDPPRRAAAALERAQGRDVRRRPAARAAGVHSHARGGDPVLLEAPAIKPGVTGWAQLGSDYSSDAEGAASKLSYDLWYLRHRNLLVDLAICAKTFSSVVLRPGR